jgi:DNA-binding beta-propeller fold protein YncE
VALIGDTGTAAATNGLDYSVSIFDEHTGHVLASIATGKEPDGVLFEPKTALLFITNEGSQDATLIDPVALRSVATIPLGGKPEYPAANGEGLIYVNIQSKSEIAVIDVVTRKIVRSIALPGCASPTGLAYDQGDSLLLTVCLNGIALFVDAQSGDIRHSFKIGTKADAAIFDSRRHRAFVSSGGDGALNIFAVRGLKDIALEQTLRTSRGARTLALDPRTGRLYLPSGTRSSFTILVVAPTNEEALSDSAHRPSEAGRH